MKKLALLALVSTPAFAAEVCETTSTSKYCENAAINQIKIENDVDVFSSRQNVWICGVGIKSEGGSDNRVYYTKTIYKKGRDEQLSTSNKVLEAPATGNNAGQYVHATSANENVFSKTREARISDIRVELASLNYGAEIYVDVCGEMPFAYYEGMPEDERRDYKFVLNTVQQTLNLDVAPNVSRGEYILAAGLNWKTEGQGTDSYNPKREFSRTEFSSNPWTALANAGNSVTSDLAGFGAPFVSVVTGNSQLTTTTVIDYTAGETPVGYFNDLDKYVVRYTLSETSSDKRLKGLTEGLKWRQKLDAKLDITDL